MQIRHSVSQFFGRAILPAVSCAVVAYFGYYAVWGERGMLALSDVQAQLGVRQEALAQARDDRLRLVHRIDLMRAGDPDIVEELAHKQLMIGGANEVAVSRANH